MSEPRSAFILPVQLSAESSQLNGLRTGDELDLDGLGVAPVHGRRDRSPRGVGGAGRDVDEAVHLGSELNVVSKAGVTRLQKEAAVLLNAHLLEDVQRVVRS